VKPLAEGGRQAWWPQWGGSLPAPSRIQQNGGGSSKATQCIGLEAQFFCTADPAGWDPLWGGSPVHFDGHLHAAGLREVLARAVIAAAAAPTDT
jgi:hypothetical protein